MQGGVVGKAKILAEPVDGNGGGDDEAPAGNSVVIWLQYTTAEEGRMWALSAGAGLPANDTGIACSRASPLPQKPLHSQESLETVRYTSA